jgi:hypothetical protein
MEGVPTSGTAMTAVPSSSTSATPKPLTPAQQAAQAQAAAASITDCCICLYPVTVCQALFIAPCSHVTVCRLSSLLPLFSLTGVSPSEQHFKCIRPLVEQNYPGFCCPLCRTVRFLPLLPFPSPPTHPFFACASTPTSKPTSKLTFPKSSPSLQSSTSHSLNPPSVSPSSLVNPTWMPSKRSMSPLRERRRSGMWPDREGVGGRVLRRSQRR